MEPNDTGPVTDPRRPIDDGYKGLIHELMDRYPDRYVVVCFARPTNAGTLIEVLGTDLLTLEQTVGILDGAKAGLTNG